MNLSLNFRRYVIPSMISSIILGTFSIIDGIFIGNKIGDIGLAAINYAYPITAFIQSIGFGIGIAGAIMMSIASGKKEDDKKYISNTYLSFLISIIILMPLFFILAPSILTLFGATNETHKEALTYINCIIFATIPQVLAQGLVPLARNKGYNKTVMVAVISGLVVNLILDWVFIYPLNMSLYGAALATNLAQVTTVLIILPLLFNKSFKIKFQFDLKIVLRIFRYSFSPFGVSFATNIVLIIINKACSIYASDQAVAAYTATAYITFIVQRLIQGVGDGVQPLMSISKGEGNRKHIIYYLKKSLILALILALISTIISISLRNVLGIAFGISNEANTIFKTAIIIFATSYLFQAITRIAMSYYYSQENELYSMIIVYGEPLFVFIVCLIFPKIFGMNGIWLSIPIAHFILSIISVVLIFIENNNEKKKVSNA